MQTVKAGRILKALRNHNRHWRFFNFIILLYHFIMRIIAHLDMDAFFAAIEERDHEWLCGKPIVVGADPEEGRGRGVVSTANYKAREYGIRSAMPITRAWQLSEHAQKQGKPVAIFVGTDFQRYRQVSESIFQIIQKCLIFPEEVYPLKFSGGKFERASVDEAYVEIINNKLSVINDDWEDAKKLCLNLKAEIKQKERLTCSIGIGPNKLIAKIASDFKKPDGLTVVTAEEAERFLEPMLIRKIPGIGPKTEELLKRFSVATVGDLKKFSEAELYRILGTWGIELYKKIRGIDNAPLVEVWEAKSIGEQETFARDTLDPNFILERVQVMCRSILDRMEREKFKDFRTVVLTVRLANFETKSRTHTLSKPARVYVALYAEALKLLMPFFDRRENPHLRLIRLIGVRIEKLNSD